MMSPRNEIEFADRLSRRRALLTGVATLFFLALQVIVRPVFRTDGYGASGPRAYAWMVNAGLLLLLLLPIGGLKWGRRVRELVNDDVSRANARSAATIGFWVAMLLGLILYGVAVRHPITGREATYLIVTPGSGVALLSFSWLELRAHRDG